MRYRPPAVSGALLLVLATGLVFCPSAQGQARFGGQVSWGDDADFAVGVRVEAPLTGIHPNLRVIGAFDYFFPDDEGIAPVDLSYWEITGAVIHIFVIPGGASAQPYAGAGVNLARASISLAGASDSDSEAGLALIAGSRFKGARVTPFGEVRLPLAGAEQFVLSVGILF